MNLKDVLNTKTMQHYSDKVVKAVIEYLGELVQSIVFSIKFTHNLHIDYKRDDIIIHVNVDIDYPILDYDSDCSKEHYFGSDVSKKIRKFIELSGCKVCYPASTNTMLIENIGYSINEDKIINLSETLEVCREISFCQSTESCSDYKDII